MLDQPYMTDLIEANSMSHEPNIIDIYSASWGPTDDGKTVDGPRHTTMKAIVHGINEVSVKNNIKIKTWLFRPNELELKPEIKIKIKKLMFNSYINMYKYLKSKWNDESAY